MITIKFIGNDVEEKTAHTEKGFQDFLKDMRNICALEISDKYTNAFCLETTENAKLFFHKGSFLFCIFENIDILLKKESEKIGKKLPIYFDYSKARLQLDSGKFTYSDIVKNFFEKEYAFHRPEKIDYVKILICDPSMKDEDGKDIIVNTFGPFGTDFSRKNGLKLKPGQYELVVGNEEYEKAFSEWEEAVKLLKIDDYIERNKKFKKYSMNWFMK
jgi:hypothetical protein